MANTANLVTYKFKGKNIRGRIVKGEISEKSEEDARIKLKRNGITNATINKKSNLGFKKGKIKTVDVILFTRQLSTMLRSGLPLMDAFEIIIDGLSNAKMKEIIILVRDDMQQGDMLAQAFSKHPKHFTQLFCALVEAGEKSGQTGEMLDRVATYLEKSEMIKKKIKKALAYPTIVLIASIIATIVLLVKVIPVFSDMFESFGSELPAFTQMVVNASEIVQAYWFYGVGIAVASYFALKHQLEKNEDFKKKFDKNLLKMPIIGNILYKSVIARFSQTLAVTFSAGVPLIEALDSASKACDNKFYEEIVQEIKSDVQTGSQLNFSMRTSCLFPPIAVQMTSIGEEAGSLDTMLSKVATYYEIEVDNAVDGLSAMIEPIIMSFLAVLVGGLVIAMYLPLFSIGGAM